MRDIVRARGGNGAAELMRCGNANGAKRLKRGFFERDPVVCARELVGCTLVWDGLEGVIVETEAYAAEGDPACHTFARPSARAFVATQQAGDAYVYLNYGMYWLFNLLVKGGGNDGFVLIRAIEPASGISEMRKRRGGKDGRDLCSGPGKLCRAFGIDGTHHGESLVTRSGRCFLAPGQPVKVKADVRVGISKARRLKWRFVIDGNAHVSVPPGRVKGRSEKSKKRMGPTRSRKCWRPGRPESGLSDGAKER